MINEVIKNIDSVYSVSNLGKFYKNGVEMKGWNDGRGYVQVFMHNKKYYLHRLVALAFPEICGEWFEGAQVDHINTIRDDDRAINLRFVSPRGNCNNPLSKKHMSDARNGKHHTEESKKKMSKAKKGRKPNWLMKPVLQFSRDGEFIREWSSAREVQRVLGYDNSSLGKCCKNIFRTAYGYIWKYKEAV